MTLPSLDSLRRVVIGGSWITKKDIKKFKSIAPHADICVLYGSTEVEPIARIEGNELLRDRSGKGMNVGSILEDLEYKFIKIHQANVEFGRSGWGEWEVENGRIGELILSGPHVCREYYNNTEAARMTKIKETNGKVWHRTGDVGYLDEKGRLRILGRIHNVIKRGNECLFPIPAEMLLKELDFVREAAFLGMENKVCAIISLKKSYEGNEVAQYMKEARKQLEQNRIPLDEIKIVRKIPTDPRHHSKVEYSKLRTLLE